MKYSTILSDSIHVLLFIYLNKQNDLSSVAIAKSIYTNPSYIRQIMSKLRKAGLINSRQGTAKPEISKPLNEISMLDVYRAIEGNKPLLHLDTETNKNCNLGVYIVSSIEDCYQQIQKHTENKMKKITLNYILKTYYKKIKSPD